MKVEEFNRSASTTGLILPSQGVIIVWKWSWDDNESDAVESDSSITSDVPEHYNPDLQSDISDSENDNSSSCIGISDTVTFKCIGTVHDHHAQETLSKVVQLQKTGVVSVRLKPEPENTHDSKAIAIQCLVDEEWHRIGYIVREALDEVHNALNQEKIVNVSFSWVKYLVVWQRSGPGFYAGVDITINGKWCSVIHKSASTR